MPRPAWFAAIAVREADGTVIWMFPHTANGKSRKVPAGKSSLKNAILLDYHYPKGRYEVIGLFSDTPLNRSQIKNRINDYENGIDSSDSAPGGTPGISKVWFDIKDK